MRDCPWSCEDIEALRDPPRSVLNLLAGMVNEFPADATPDPAWIRLKWQEIVDAIRDA